MKATTKVYKNATLDIRSLTDICGKKILLVSLNGHFVMRSKGDRTRELLEKALNVKFDYSDKFYHFNLDSIYFKDWVLYINDCEIQEFIDISITRIMQLVLRPITGYTIEVQKFNSHKYYSFRGLEYGTQEETLDYIEVKNSDELDKEIKKLTKEFESKKEHNYWYQLVIIENRGKNFNAIIDRIDINFTKDNFDDEVVKAFKIQ